VKKRDARAGRNPKTGVMVNIAENRTVSFKTGKELKERIDFKSVG
ncbi:MAG: HU family DNA-binding protein, partial [Thermodesulfobacteriota bacterium]|nr:HU family DNA-binding protein [Thermodesulfobacteriota bacterium]